MHTHTLTHTTHTQTHTNTHTQTDIHARVTRRVFSFAAVDTSRGYEELAGFITARLCFVYELDTVVSRKLLLYRELELQFARGHNACRRVVIIDKSHANIQAGPDGRQHYKKSRDVAQR